MDVSVDYNPGEDFGTLVFSFGKDDSYVFTPGIMTIPLYSSEARDIVEALKNLAEEPEA